MCWVALSCRHQCWLGGSACIAASDMYGDGNAKEGMPAGFMPDALTSELLLAVFNRQLTKRLESRTRLVKEAAALSIM